MFALLAEAARKEQEYDYIVIDADSVFDEEKAALMQLADKILIVTQRKYILFMFSIVCWKSWRKHPVAVLLPME